MGLLDAIFHPEKNKIEQDALNNARATFKMLTGYRPAFTTWGGNIYESELVRAAIDARARHISKLKVEFQGSARPSLQAKMRLAPNQWQTYSQFLYRTSVILDIHNTAIIVPVRDENLETTGYFPILPNRCEVVDYEGEPWLRYHFAHGQTAATPLYDCAVLTRHQYRSDFFGETNSALDETMKLVHVNNEGIEEAVKSSAQYKWVAELANFSKPSDIKNERLRFTEENLTSDSDASGILLFPNTYKNVRQVTTNPYTVDVDEMKLIQTNIFNYFGVNEDVLQNKAYGDAWSAFYEGCVEVFAIQFSEAMSAAMFTTRERAQGSSVMATSNRLQYLSNADKLAVSAQMADRGIMTRNEIREIWNLPPVEGGDVPTIRGEYYLINDDGTITKDNGDSAEEVNNGNE